MNTYTRKDYTEWLNELGIPEDDKESNGGRIPDDWEDGYGEWVRRYDPVAFNVGYQERCREYDHYRSTKVSYTSSR